MVFAWETYALQRSRLPCGCVLCHTYAILEKWVEDGKFNPEQMAESDYSHSMAILVILSPNAQGTALESVGIRVGHLPV